MTSDELITNTTKQMSNQLLVPESGVINDKDTSHYTESEMVPRY